MSLDDVKIVSVQGPACSYPSESRHMLAALHGRVPHHHRHAALLQDRPFRAPDQRLSKVGSPGACGRADIAGHRSLAVIVHVLRSTRILGLTSYDFVKTGFACLLIPPLWSRCAAWA